MAITITIKTNCLVIKAITFFTWLFGAILSWYGSDWYHTLVMPAVQPSEKVTNSAWFFIFFCTSTVALVVWNRFKNEPQLWTIISLLGTSAFLYLVRNWLFFYCHYMGAALLAVFLLEVVTVALIYFVIQLSQAVSALLLVQAAWLVFEIFLNLMLWHLN